MARGAAGEKEPLYIKEAAPLWQGRANGLDRVRGFSVVSMVAWHTLYDLTAVFGHSIPWFAGAAGRVWQQSICWVFILVAGAAQHYGRRPVRRGFLVLGCGAVVTVASLVVMPQWPIWWGVLHLLGACMLLGALARPLLQKVPPVPGAVASMLLFLLCRQVPGGWLGLFGHRFVWLPRPLYHTWALMPLGFPPSGFSAGDYYPLVPWMFLFFAGWFIWAGVKPRAVLRAPARDPLAFLGRHSLWVYMLHQPVVYGVLWLLRGAGAA